ncbi:hypothetical protein [uncultured Sphingomonas sp.]|uniref:hypothetical protein n=1 Tax=uncultured Sphingomonas sp. TaxID=158754 RepID=UPI0035CB598A
MTPDDEDLIRSRQDEELIRKRRRSRSLVLALLLGALVLLVFAVSITRITQGMDDAARAATDKGPSQMPRPRLPSPSPAP